MIFAWMGYLKPGAGPIPQSVQLETTDFLSQPYINIHTVGQLLDKSGERVGMMMIFEVPDRHAAEKFVEGSPYLQAGLYEQHSLHEYQLEVGEF